MFEVLCQDLFFLTVLLKHMLRIGARDQWARVHALQAGDLTGRRSEFDHNAAYDP